MYFLNGDRIYINPANSCGTWEEQMHNCLGQLTEFNSGKKIFKLNFFVDAATCDDYKQIQQKIQKEVSALFSENILQSVVAQPPLTCKIIIEACFYDPEIWTANFITDEINGAVLLQNSESRVLIGNVQSFSGSNCKENSENAFSSLNTIFESMNFAVNSIVRQWNYIGNILGFDGHEQRYQVFNNARTLFYGNHFDGKSYPAATGIGMQTNGIIIEFLAIESALLKTFPINNPAQIAAHSYSENVLEGEGCVLKTTPKFERARYLELLGKKIIFISGTASIIGEKTVGINDAGQQTEVTISNIKNLYSKEVLAQFSDTNVQPKYGHARVYVKNRSDFHSIRTIFKKHFGKLPVVYIIADICRENLLVEIEGKVILE